MCVYAVENRRSTWYIGVKRTKNGISEYGEHAADDVSVGCSRISGEKKEYHWRDRTQRHGQFLGIDRTQEMIRRAQIVLQVVDATCPDRKSTRLNSSHIPLSRMPSSA